MLFKRGQSEAFSYSTKKERTEMKIKERNEGGEHGMKETDNRDDKLTEKEKVKVKKRTGEHRGRK